MTNEQTLTTQQHRARMAAARSLLQMGADLRPSSFSISPHGPISPRVINPFGSRS